MKKLTRSALSAAVVAAVSTGGLAMTATATAEMSANIGVVSNYYFRGVTQTLDSAAVQGGVDFEDASGFYAGAWTSNVDFDDGTSYELDLYLGFAGEVANGIGYDVGYVYYAYPDAPDSIDFGEIYGELSYEMFYAGLAYTINSDNDDGLFDSGDAYYYVGAGLPLPEDFSLGLTLGYYDFDNDGSADVGDASYSHFAVNLAKDAGDLGEFSLNFEYADIDEGDALGTVNSDDLKTWVGWSKGF
ncbi:TorF family putative porin [Thioalkalivibrio sp.]|uniref:TorF family putative porin n=1 Tax=Thioalkalivibrio sp. TaxID=2093813 RepID=UPI0035652345